MKLKFLIIISLLVIMSIGLIPKPNSLDASIDHDVFYKFEPGYIVFEKEVEATAYNPEDPRQTDDTPGVCAWMHQFELGDRIIAVSRNLEPLGLTNGQVAMVEGYGQYTVRDRMNKRYVDRIDIAISDVGTTFEQRYEAALDFSVQNLKITWLVWADEPIELSKISKTKYAPTRVISPIKKYKVRI